MNKNILVIGSINMDLIVSTDEIPKIGETVLGKSLTQNPGGKGANQAVAASKLGGSVDFLGMVGEDIYGEKALESIKKGGVNTDSIKRLRDTSTGIAVISVDSKGDNNIIVIQGANNEIDKEYIENNKNLIEKSDIIVIQLEIPLETVRYTLETAKKLGKTTILNPAPAGQIGDDILKYVDILIPNEHELRRITEMEVKNDETLVKAAEVLVEKGIEKLIVTLGESGVMYMDKEGYKLYPGYKVDVVDTTAAGDSFIGGFVSSYAEGENVGKAIEIGQKTAALCVQKKGAQVAMPSREEVEKFWKNT